MTFYDNKEHIACVNCGSRLNFAGSNIAQCCSRTYKLDMYKKGFNLSQYTTTEWAAFQAGIKDKELTVESLAPEKQEIVDNETLTILKEINDKDVVQPSSEEDTEPLTEEQDEIVLDEDAFVAILMEEQKTDDIEQEEVVNIDQVINEDTQIIVDGTESLSTE